MFFNRNKDYEISTKLTKISIALEQLVLEKIKITKQDKEESNLYTNIEALIERFYRLFELHNILPSEIPQIIDKKFNISINDVATKDNLLKIINIELLEWLSEYFGVNVNWLLGRADMLYQEHNFDKFEMSFFRLINSLSKENDFIIEFIKTCNLIKNDSNKQEQLVYPIVRVALTKLNGRTIYKTILINKYIWDYKRSRLDFKAIIYMLYNGYVDYYGQKIYIKGYDINEKVSRYDFMKGLISYDNLKDRGGLLTWYPSDFIEYDSTISLENEELEAVLSKIKEENLVNSCKEYLDFWNKQEKEKNDIKQYDDITINKYDTNNLIIIYTEGKTDIVHLENAWKVLFGEKHNFKFISFDGMPKLASHINSSNEVLENHISNNKIIAIFDSDETGIKEFKRLTGKDPKEQFALAKNSNKIFIILIPPSEPDLNGLCEIEFLYPKDILDKYAMIISKDFNEIMKLHSNNRRIAYEIDDKFKNGEKVEELKYYKIIEDRKNIFAQEILSDISIEKKDLKSFGELFKLINQVLEK